MAGNMGLVGWIHTTGQLLKRKEPAPERMFHYKEYEIVVKVKKMPKKERSGISYVSRTITCTNRLSGKLQWEKSIVSESSSTSYSSYIIRNSLWLDVGEENFGVINIKTGKVKRAAFNNIGYYDFLYTLKNGFVRWTEDHRIEYTNLRHPRKSWVYETPEGDRVYRPFNGPKSTNDKILYLQANRNAIRAFNLRTGKVDWEFSSVSKITSNLVIADDVLYFTDGDGLVALDVSEKNDKKRWDDYHLRFPDEKNKEESEPELLSEEYRTPMGEKFDEQDVLGDFVVYIRTKNAKGKQIAIKFNMPGRVVLYNGEVVKDNKIEGYTIKKDFEKIYLRAEKIKAEE
ncbi:outer membrane protein assembly factor BamB family protein [Saccharicrinis fermentans]|uniref:outer membrane protein assembly factor BamB family protein n=1 Tax=Saccharicrinis fermentans TaxID=982 RepID=UPI0004848B37|nr:PQQ-binding-like beta-propeller repeat protein [Saccharicrinis fermentans]